MNTFLTKCSLVFFIYCNIKFQEGFDFQEMQGCFIFLDISVALNENLVGWTDMQPITMLSFGKFWPLCIVSSLC